MCYADVEPYGGWVFGGYLVDSVEALKEKASEYYGDDDLILVENCSVYDEDAWDITYRIKVCTPNRLVLERCDSDFDNNGIELFPMGTYGR